MNDCELGKLTAAEELNWWHLARYELILSLLSKLGNTKNYLEVGPGTGKLGEWITKHNTYCCVETNKTQCIKLRKKGLQVIEGDAERLAVKKDSMDVYLAFDVLEHTDNDQGAINEAYRVLKKGGVIIISVPLCKQMYSGHDIAVGHKRRYEIDEIKSILRNAGFIFTGGFSWNVILFPFIYCYRVHFSNKKNPESEVSIPNPIINSILLAILRIENIIAPAGIFPYGVSYFLVGEKSRK